MSEDVAVQRLTPRELRTLFLFESLDDDKLEWLAENGRVEHRAAGDQVYAEGERATCFYVLLGGTIVLRRTVEGAEVDITQTNQRGVYAGATWAYVNEDLPAGEERPYSGSMSAVTDAELFVLDARAFGSTFRRWFPMAAHMLEGIFIGMRASQAIVGQRERLLALGRMSAGLTHELNNPAAAAVRATAALRERVSAMRRKLGALASGALDAETMLRLTDLQEEAVERVATAPDMSPLEASDAEDELIDWLDDHDVTDSWQLAPSLVASAVTVEWLEKVVAALPPEKLESGLRWLTYALDAELLMNEISHSTQRISSLVTAAKQYSQMDRAAHQFVDVHEGLTSTLVMFGPKLTGLTLVKQYDRDLPDVPAYPAELNQVWTNLVDNAIGAMQGSGTLTVRTTREGECVLVEIGDSGPGVPPELRERIFEPFFTTKPVGEGTGLGLDISYRIVGQRHGGDLRVVSEPGDTRFQVRLPLREPPAPAE